jgi:hypothetical protein
MRSVLLTIASNKSVYLVTVGNDTSGDSADLSKNIRVDYDSYDELKAKLKKVVAGTDLWGTTDKAAESVPDASALGKELLAATAKCKTKIEAKAPFVVEMKGDIHLLLVSMPSPNIDLVM